MENNQPKKKNAGLTALIALLLVITTIASCIGIYAWAKYTKSQNGSATAQVAKWSFNVRLKKGDSSVSLASEAIDLATTIDHVANGKIAPGTSGTFDIEIDTTGTEVDMQYDVTISLANCPRNITFSRKTGVEQGQDVFTAISAGGASNAQDLTRTGITFSEYVTKGNNGVHVERIKWDWPYSDANDANYDARDNADEDTINSSQSKKVTMSITVTGEEKLEEPVDPNSVKGLAKAGTIKVGDTVNYSPASGSVTVTAAQSGAESDQTFSTANNSGMTWRVLSVDSSSGEVKIVGTPTSENLRLQGKAGFANAETVLNNIASIYGGGTGAASARSITEDDVFDAIGYNKAANYQGETHTYTSGEFFTENWDNSTGTATYSTTTTIATAQNPVTVHNTSHNSAANTFISTGYGGIVTASDTLENGTDDEKAYMGILFDNLLFNSNDDLGQFNYWLASRFISAQEDESDGESIAYCVRYVSGDLISSGNWYDEEYGCWLGVDYLFASTNSESYEKHYSFRVAPVITLQSNIGLEKTNNVWNFAQ